MTLQMLEYFVALAEKGSFTDAAAACFVTQPALSRAIATLEKELDCTLVDREIRKTVKLTPAGETLLVEAQRIFKQMDVMCERVRRVHMQTQREISVGYIAYGVLRDFRQACAPALRDMEKNQLWIRTVYGSTPELRERVLSGELDCALLMDSSSHDMPGCRALPVFESEGRVMIPSGHPLFNRESVRLEELRHSKFVFFDPFDLPMLYVSQIEACRAAGFTPEIVGFGHKAGDVASLVQRHGAVTLMTTSFDYVQTDDLRLVPLHGLSERESRSVYSLVMLEKPVNPAMEEMAAAIRAHSTVSVPAD